MPALTEAFQLFDSIHDRQIFALPPSTAELNAAEAQTGIHWPPALRAFIGRYGAVDTRSEFKLFGLGVAEAQSPSLLWAWRWMQFATGATRDDLLPLGPVGENRFACLRRTSAEGFRDDDPVIAWAFESGAENKTDKALWPSYADYLYQIAWELRALDQSLHTLRGHMAAFAEDFDYEHEGTGKLPRAHDWRPYRFCSQDIVLGAHVQRHVRGGNYLEVDVFLPIDVWPFEPGGSLLGLTTSVLADAYQCGGSMEIRFTANVDGGQVPRKLQALAAALGAPIKPESLARRRLDPVDSRRLFVALTDFSPAARERLAAADARPERACFVVQRGIWSKPEAEALLLSHPDAERVFAGAVPPEARILFQQDLLHARAALLAGYLDRALALREHELSGTETLALEDDVRQVETGFEPGLQARVYRVLPAVGETEESFVVPWQAEGSLPVRPLHFGEAFLVLVRARSAADLAGQAPADIETAGSLQRERGMPACLLVTQDWYDPALEGHRRAWLGRAADLHVGIHVCAEAVEGLDDEAFRRFAASRVVHE
jgi:hypothetical protein